jgi:hypothetical protein
VSNRRETMIIEFTPPDVAGVADALAKLRHAGDGWMNLLPGIDEDTVDIVPPSGLSAFFGTLPAKPDRRDREGMTVGLMHPTGAKAVARLAEAGIALPEGWVLRQDHVRRGLVARTPVEADEAAVVEWCVRAGTALCRAEMTGRWRAVVYLP